MNYVERISEITCLNKNIENIYISICETDYGKAYDMLLKDMTKIAEVMTEFIEKAELLKQYELDIPGDVLLAQLQNLLEAYEQRDYVMLADTLHYEIADSFNFYMEILQELDKENIQI